MLRSGWERRRRPTALPPRGGRFHPAQAGPRRVGRATPVRPARVVDYVAKGGDPGDWDPTWFFPHITLGFTHADLHEHQGVLKNIKHSWDRRFRLVLP